MKKLDAELINAQWHEGTARREDVAELCLYNRRDFRGMMTRAEHVLTILEKIARREHRELTTLERVAGMPSPGYSRWSGG